MTQKTLYTCVVLIKGVIMFNFGMGGYDPMMSGMGMMGMMGMGMSGMNGSGNVYQSFKAKYGCEDCFQKEPHPFDAPVPIIFPPKEEIKPSLWGLIKRKLGC